MGGEKSIFRKSGKLMYTQQEIKAHYTIFCPAKRIGGVGGATIYNKEVELEECKHCPWLKNWSVGKMIVKCDGEGAEL